MCHIGQTPDSERPRVERSYVAAFAYGRGRSSDVVPSPGCANIDRGVAVTKNSTERE